MDFINLLLLLLSVISFFLSLFIFSRDTKSQTNRSFALLILSGAIWALSIAMFRQSKTFFSALLWDWIIYLCGTISATSFLWFSFVFPSPKPKISFSQKVLIIFPILFFLPLIGTQQFIADINVYKHHVVLGPLYLAWSCFFFLFFGLGFIKLFKNFRSSIGFQRLQLKYILYSFILPGIFSSLYNVILPYLGNYRDIWVGPFCLTAMVAIISYAIIVHRLMDIRLILKDLFAKFLTLTTLSLACILAAYLFGVVSHYPVHWQVVFPIVGAMTLTVFTFPLILRKSEIFTRKYLVRGSYDPKIFIKKLTDILNSTIGFEQMVNESAETIAKGLNVKFASFLLIVSRREKNLSNYKLISSQNGIKKWENLMSLNKFFQFHHGPFVSEEFEKKKNLKIEKPSQEIINQIKENEIAVILPLKIKSEISGYIFLGNKPSVDSFTVNDIDILETFASQASFAIENARLFSEVQSFNERLKEEIQKATGELTSQNKFLAALRRLDLIIMELLSLEDLCQKIVNSLSWELKCQFTIIGLVDEIKNRLYFKSASADSDLAKELVRKRLLLEDIYFPLGKENGILTKAISTKRSYSSSELKDIFSPHLSEETIQKWQTLFKVKTIWVYPIISQGRALGICVFAWEKAESEISSKDRDLMQNVIDQTGIALDRTLLYEKLKVSNRRLKIALTKQLELDRMKDEFVSIASHELRTPMTSINSYLWMVLNKKGGEINPKQKFYLERAAISTQRSINLVNDMLTVSRIEGGKLGVNLVEGDILALAQTITDELQTKAKEKKVKLFLESPSKELPLVVLDSEKIREVLNNLIGNAIKFTDPQGQVVVSFKKKGNFVFTFITDTGRGIAKNDIPKLFKKFGRLDRSFATVAETGGTGLGLYISKQIIDLHHGKIGVESKPAKGSTFYFSLKAARGK